MEGGLYCNTLVMYYIKFLSITALYFLRVHKIKLTLWVTAVPPARAINPKKILPEYLLINTLPYARYPMIRFTLSTPDSPARMI